MSPVEKRKYDVSRTDAAMSKCIKGLHLDAETEEKLYTAIYKHTDAVRRDVYEDAVSDTVALLSNQMVDFTRKASKLASENLD